MTIPHQGMLAISFFETSAALILLVLFLLLRRSFRAPFFRLWVLGWTVYAAQDLAHLFIHWRGGGLPARLVSLELCWGASLLFLAALLHYVARARWASLLWPAGAAGAAVMALSAVWLPGSLPVAWAAAFFQTAPYLLGGWLLWRRAQSRRGYGPALLAAALLLHALHGMDSAAWHLQSGYLLRESFDGLLDVAIGIAMVILVLEAAHARTEHLNEKLRRLTLITTAASQTFNVDEVLREALVHLVESLNASHGLVRLLDGEGDTAALVLRASVGFDRESVRHRLRVSVCEPWARRVLEQESPFLASASAPDPEVRRLMEAEKLAALVLVRLPGKDTTLGLLGIGSDSPRDFQDDEVAFLVNVANLLGLTVHNVWLFEQVARAQNHWKYTFDSITDPILVHDEHGTLLRVNRAVSEGLGAEPTALVGWPLSRWLRRGNSLWRDCPYCEGVEGKGNAPDPTFGGHLLASTSDFHDAAGKPLGTVHVLNDITERRKAEERYRNLFENVQEGVFISTPEGRFLDFNDTFMRMLGYTSREELQDVDIASTLYVHAADRERLKKLLREHGAVTDFEFQMRRKDGEVLTVCESSFAARDASGTVIAYQGFLLDITERKRAELEIRRRNRELLVLNSIAQTLGQSLPLEELLERALREVAGLFSADLAALYLLEERGGLLRRQAAVGFRSEYARLFPPVPVPPELLESLRTARATVVSGQSLQLPPAFRDLVQKEGILVSHVVVLWAKERILGALTVASRSPREFSAAELNLLAAVGAQIASTIERSRLHEETRRAYENLRRAQEQLLQSEKMAAVGQLISGVAHELNNPLTAVLGYGQLLTGSEHVSPRGAEYVAKLYKQAQRTHRIVQNLLSFARQRKPERQAVRVNQVVEDTLLLREYDLKVNNVRLHRHLDPRLPLVTGDPHQLQQVFLNILNNAVDAIVDQRSPGHIWARTAASDGRLLVEFADSGPGVRDPLRVFDPFYTTKPVGKGTGLGLSICYGIIKEHGGEVTVDNSPEPGRGAIFRVWLPLLPLPARPEPTPESLPAAKVCGTVLLVDDEETLLDLEKEILCGYCSVVLTARGGREALQLLQRETVDLVVTDLKMPGDISGPELYSWIRRHRPRLAHHVVFTTSHARTDEVRLLLEETRCPCLQKPFRVEEFVSTLRRVAGQPIPAAT